MPNAFAARAAQLASASANSRVVRPLLMPGLIAAMAAMVIWALPSKLNQLDMLDPYIYTALIHDYDAVVSRFGATYYASRVAFVWPAGLFVDVFGDTWGYLSFRWLFLSAGCVSAYAIAREYYGRSVGLAAAMFFCLYPPTLRSIMWDHYDGFGLIYLMIGAALVLVPNKRPLLSCFAAGCSFALACNCNLFSLAIGGPLAIPFLMLRRQQSVQDTTVQIGHITLGFLATYAVISTAAYAAYPVFGWFIEETSLKQAGSQLGGVGRNWFSRIEPLLRTGHFYIFATASMWLALGAYLLSQRSVARPFAIASFFYATSVLFVFWSMHTIVGGGAATIFYYISWQTLAAVLIVTALLGETLRDRGVHQRVFFVAAFAASCASMWAVEIAIGAQIPRVPALTFFALVLALVLALALLRGPWWARPTLTAALLAAAVLSFFQNEPTNRTAPYRVLAMFSQKAIETDTYNGALTLQRSIEGVTDPDDGTLGLWFDRHTPHVHSIASMYLYMYGSLVSPTVSVMPEVTPDLLNALLSRRYVALIGRDRAQVDAGLAALANERVRYERILQRSFVTRNVSYELVLIENLGFTPDLGRRLADIDLRTFLAMSDGTRLGPPFRFDTPASIWSYAATINLAHVGHGATGPAILKIRVRVQEGRLGVAIGETDDHSLLAHEITANESPSMRDYYFEVENAQNVHWIIFRNVSDDGPSRAQIESVEIFSSVHERR